MFLATLVLGLAVPAEAGRGAADPKRVEAMRQMRDGKLKVGDAAPSPTVVTLDGAERPLLAERSDKPLVLIFGSFT